MEIQQLLGSDIQMVLDECPRVARERGGDREILAGAVDALGEAFEGRVRRAAGPRLFRHRAGRRVCADLRQRSRPKRCARSAFDGLCVGGLAVGEGQSAMFDTLEATVPHLPADRPRYLMGVGKPADIVGAVLRGIDMFDCVLPTRSGRNGQAFTREGALNLRNARFAEDDRAARCRLPVPGLRQLFARLSASCGEGRRDHRQHAAHLAQSRALSAADVLAAPSDRRSHAARAGGDHRGRRIRDPRAAVNPRDVSPLPS